MLSLSLTAFRDLASSCPVLFLFHLSVCKMKDSYCVRMLGLFQFVMVLSVYFIVESSLGKVNEMVILMQYNVLTIIYVQLLI